MKKIRSLSLLLAVIFSSSALSFSQQVQDASGPALKRAVAETAVSFGLSPDTSTAEMIRLESPVASQADADVRALAPEPGRDLAPVVRDEARVRAILKLISDIYYGKPLPYKQDGSTFKNKEKRLPLKPAGFYKEYTLLTGSAPHTVTIGETVYQVAPDLSARGSERIIIGGGEMVYYTPDHYKNFIRLTVVK